MNRSSESQAESVQEKRTRLEQLREEVSQLEEDLRGRPADWQAREYYATYHATSGFFLGMLGAIASLLFNVIGSLIVNQSPLRIIQVYLTFPLGEKALSPDFDTGISLAIGCCLYIGTGMLLGIPFQMAMARLAPDAKVGTRLLLATALGLIIWAINFYLVLSWLQPALFGGDWIVNPKYLPPWVAGATHLVFAWTMALIYPWGKYQPYRRQTELAAS